MAAKSKKVIAFQNEYGIRIPQKFKSNDFLNEGVVYAVEFSADNDACLIFSMKNKKDGKVTSRKYRAYKGTQKFDAIIQNAI